MEGTVMKKAKIIILMGALLASAVILKAQDVVNEFQARTAIQIEYSPIKHLKLNISPELRFDENFSLDKYHIEAAASYKLSKVFAVGANYRFIINPRDTKETEYYSRFAFYAKLKKKYGDFTPSFRLAYSNFADDEDDNTDNYLRLKAALKYDIPKCKLTPVIGVEGFQNLTEKEFYKMRYSAGVDYKLFKKNFIGVRYKLDYYRTEYKNRHIISLEYKIKL